MLFLSGYPATIPLHPQGTEGRSPHIFRTRARDAEDLRQTTGGSAPETPRTSATRLPFRLFPAHEDNVSVPTSSSRRVLRPLSLFRACEDNVSTPTSSSRMIPTRAAATSSPPTAGWRQRCRQRCRGRGGSGKCGQAGRGFKPEEGSSRKRGCYRKSVAAHGHMNGRGPRRQAWEGRAKRRICGAASPSARNATLPSA